MLFLANIVDSKLSKLSVAVAILLSESVKPQFCLLYHYLLQDGKKSTDATFSFGNIKLVEQDSVKKIDTKFIRGWTLKHLEKLNALKLELREDNTSQEFICAKYEDLKPKYEKLQKINKNKPEILKSFKRNQQISKFEKQKEKERLLRTRNTIEDKI